MELALEAGWGILIPATVLLIVWYGGRLYLHEPRLADIGDITVFQIYAMMLLQPVWQIVSSVSQTQKAMAAMERVFDAFAMPEGTSRMRPISSAIDARHAASVQLRFEHVDFEYRPGVPVITAIST